jgi:hypothetical protein
VRVVGARNVGKCNNNFRKYGEKWMDFVAPHGDFLGVIGDYFDCVADNRQLGNWKNPIDSEITDKLCD